MRRAPTVVSMKQLVADSQQQASSSPSAAGGAAAAAGEKDGPVDASVVSVAGHRLPAYVYDDSAPNKLLPRRPSWWEEVAGGAEGATGEGSSSPALDICGDSSGDASEQEWTKPGSEPDDAAVVPSMPAYSCELGQQQQQQLGTVMGQSLLDTVMLALWEDCAEQGLFRYDVTECATKVVPGMYGFIAQLNEGRASNKRPTDVVIDKVCQPFSEAKFNFKKAYLKEVLIQFEPASGSSARGGKGAKGGSSAGAGPKLLESAAASASPNLVMINVSPIEYGHVLLVPRVLDSLPQALSAPTMLQALHFAREADNPYFRVGFNSLGAYATINHLHFQAYYLAAPFPVERAPTAPLAANQRRSLPPSLSVSRLTEYPVRGFVVEVLSAAPSALKGAADLVAYMVAVMQRADIPHNVLIADSGMRIFVWPQRYAEAQAAGQVPAAQLDTGVNPAVFEIAGHMVLKRAQDYEVITQAWAWQLLEQVSLSEEAFTGLTAQCFGKQ